VTTKPAVGLDGELRDLVGAVAEGLGLELVEIVFRRAGRRQFLRVDIDRVGADGVNLDDCQRMSHAIGTALDETDLIPSSYELEVSSPGADRPIRSDDDFRRNTGRRIVVVARDDETGERSITGRLVEFRNDCLVLESDAGRGPVRIPLDRIVNARQELGF
jgi:ribosome maturation factor RimP